MLCCVSGCAVALSGRGERGLIVAVHRLLTVSLDAEPRLWISGSGVVAHGLVALWHVESSCIRDQTCVPCFGWQILNHWTTREELDKNNFTRVRIIFLHYL